MKISLALGPRRPLSRQTAWGCFTTNLALPGFGSLIAGHKVGYAQAVLTMTGFVVSVLGAVRLFGWYVTTGRQLQDSEDPFVYFQQAWLAMRWAVLGLGLFGFALLWALTTSVGILREAKKNESENVPPRLG
jgi:hypothetical protein